LRFEPLPRYGSETAPGTNAGIACATIWAELTPGAGTPIANEIISAYDASGPPGDGTVSIADVSFVMAEALKIALGVQPRRATTTTTTAR
jgi:hypothetical protein